MSETTTLTLDASSVLSKWGFEDGDIIINNYEPEATTILGADRLTKDELNNALVQLVREHLIPAIEAAGHTIKLENVSTIHNPAIAVVLDGEPVTSHLGDDTRLAGIEVEVPREAVIAAVLGAKRDDA